MSANYDLSNLALKAVCPNNEILYDDKGKPSVMVYIPKMTYAQLGLGSSTAIFPAFLVNGQEVAGIYFSKYEPIVMDGRAYSLPGEDPKTRITFDQAISACTAKGAGWHLITRFEWALLALWCKANGTQPKGNNNYGKDASESVRKAIPTHMDGANVGRVATGTGPLSWSHDGTPSGIWDLDGNVWEWCGGMRLVYGELQILENNNAADSSKSQAASSAQWMAIKASDGTLITPDGSGTTTGSVKLSWDTDHLKWDTTVASAGNHDCNFEAITCSANIGDAAKLLLQALALFKYDETEGAYNGDRVWANTGEADKAFYCGGGWDFGANAGVFALNGIFSRSDAFGSLGFRCAYCALPSA